MDSIDSKTSKYSDINNKQMTKRKIYPPLNDLERYDSVDSEISKYKKVIWITNKWPSAKLILNYMTLSIEYYLDKILKNSRINGLRFMNLPNMVQLSVVETQPLLIDKTGI